MKPQKYVTVTLLAAAVAACSFNDSETATVEEAGTGAQSQAQTPARANTATEAEVRRAEIALRQKVLAEPAADMAAMSGAHHRAIPPAPEAMPLNHHNYQERERYSETTDNPVRRVLDNPLSTFSVDVDAASFSVVRRYLRDGRLPPADAVRTEEIINALAYAPLSALSEREPVGVSTRLMRTPWNAKTRLLQVHLNAWEPPAEAMPDSNYVFLIDVSGSMQGDDRLGLLKRAFSVMLSKLKPGDSVSLVTYAAGSRTVLEPTSVKEKHKILAALDGLNAGGSTHASDGIQRAYNLARQAFIDGGNNRVILATDGDVNVGLRDEALVEMIERQRDAGIYLTVLGVGRGNYMDAQLEPLADHGDGNYYYLDSFQEARRVLVTGLSGTAYTVAKDVKLQVEFNPAVVAEYRLIGYNNRQLADADFNNDAKDAGDIGAGHSVTALYEITLVDSEFRFVDEPRYGRKNAPGARVDELALVKLRYKSAAGEASRRRDHVVASRELKSLEPVSEAVVAAAFGEKLRQSPHLSAYDWSTLQKLGEVLDGSRDNHPDLKIMLETAALLAQSRS